MEEARSIRLLAMDVDGVLTNGDIIYSNTGEELKVFNVLDGLGIAVARHAGLMTAMVSGRTSPAVERRAEELGITHVYLGCPDKGAAMRELLAKTGLRRDEIAFVGDDVNDIPAFRECGWKIAVSSASRDVKAHADYITQQPGGGGAVREVIELILESQGKWTAAVEEYLRHLEQTECQT